MNRWPGQGYEYVENVLFEKGPFGNRGRKNEPQQPIQATKEISANQRKKLEAEAHFSRVIEKRKQQNQKKKSARQNTSSNFKSVPRGRTFGEVNHDRG